MNSQSFIATLLLLGVFHTALCLKPTHPFEFFNETIEQFEDCLLQNNMTYEQYGSLEEYDNLENLVADKVAPNQKCVIHCQLRHHNWLDQQGHMVLKLMNATAAAAEIINKCMTNASKEQCAYSFKLVMCAFEAGHPEVEWEEEEFEILDDEEDEEDVVDEEDSHNSNKTPSLTDSQKFLLKVATG